MERRRALVVAGTMTATLAMAGTAMAVNMGLLGSDNDSVGNLTATEIQPAAQREARPTAAQRTPRVRVVVQEIPVATAGGGTASGGSYTGTVESGGGAAPAPTAAPAPAPNPTAPYVDDDDDDSSYDDGGADDHGDDGAEDPSDDGTHEPDDD